MGFPKTKATYILSDVFKANNTIALLTAVDTEKIHTPMPDWETQNDFVKSER